MHKYHYRYFIDNNVGSAEFGACLAQIPICLERKIKHEKDLPVWSSLSIKCSFDEERNVIVADSEMSGCLDAERILETVREVEKMFST